MPRCLLLPAAFAAALLLAACGSSAKHAPELPRGTGLTLVGITKTLPGGPVLLPAQRLFDRDRPQRVAFGLFSVGGKPLRAQQVWLYAGRTSVTLRGPIAARRETFAVAAPFRSRTTAQDPRAPQTLYVAEVPPTAGANLTVIAAARVDGKLRRTNPTSLVGDAGPPRVGTKPPRIHTAIGGGAANDTRVPPRPELHRADLASVLGRKPVVLLFATPRLCTSRVCGPVVDVEAQVQHEFGGRVAFIHQEVYRGNDVLKGKRPQLAAFHLPTEPWLFVVDRHGVISTRIEGGFSVAELRAAVEKVL